MRITLQPVTEAERELLFRLLQYSLYEESAADGNEIGEDGLFAYRWFDAYFTEAAREAYLIREGEGGRLAGFAMINTHVRRCRQGHSIAEFMILPGHRRQGAGRQAARACFELHRGMWEVTPSLGSERAFCFWRGVIGEYTGGNYRWEQGSFLFER